MSPKLEELTWPQIQEQLTWVMEDRSQLSAKQREQLMARSLLLVIERLDGAP